MVEAMKQALEALDTYGVHSSDETCEVCEAITSLRAAIEATERQRTEKAEPVAYWYRGTDSFIPAIAKENTHPDIYKMHTVPLYTHADASEIEALRAENADLWEFKNKSHDKWLVLEKERDELLAALTGAGRRQT